MVSAFDAGFQHAVGLFETMLGGCVPVAPGVDDRSAGDAAAGAEPEVWVLHLDRHIERLTESARALGLSYELRAGALADAVMATVRRSGLARTRVRLTITGGDLSMISRGGPGAGSGGSAAGGGGGGGAHDPTVLIVAQPATNYPQAMFERGGSLVVADARANPLNPFEGHKTLNYWWRLRELQVAAGKGGSEALVLQVTNHVCSGCVSNVFAVRDGALITPIARGEEPQHGMSPGKGRSLPSPVLPGITRGWVIEEAERRGMPVKREMISAAELLEADEIFLTNSSWGVLPIVKFEASAIGDGVPGRLSRELCSAWRSQQP